MGLSRQDIATEIQTNNTDVVELRGISAMSIQRYLTQHKKDLMRQRLEKGEAVDDTIRKEFRERMYDLDDEIHELLCKAKMLLKNVEKSENANLQLKAIREASNIIEQTRKNWTSLIQFGISEFRVEKEVQHQQIIKIDKMIIDMSKELCPVCRSKVINLVADAEDDKKEENIKIFNRLAIEKEGEA